MPGVEQFPQAAMPVLGIRNARLKMFVSVVMTVLCTAAIAFYVRFLVALCKECKPRSTGYWVRLRLGSCEDAGAEVLERTKPVTRAA